MPETQSDDESDSSGVESDNINDEKEVLTRVYNLTAMKQWRRQERGHTRAINFPRERKKQVVLIFRCWIQNSVSCELDTKPHMINPCCYLIFLERS